MVSRSAGRKGRPYRRARLFVLAAYQGICHLCGHSGATDIDHDPPRTVLLRLGLDPNDPRYMRPAHGVDGCPYCPRVNGKPRRCNQSKGNRRAARAHTSHPW